MLWEAPSHLKVSRGCMWDDPDLQRQKDIATAVMMILFVLLACAAIGLVLSGLQYCCRCWQSMLQDQLGPQFAWHEMLTPLNTHFDSSLHSYPLQAWERTKGIYSPAPFYKVWVNNNILPFCLAEMNSQSECQRPLVFYAVSQRWKHQE